MREIGTLLVAFAPLDGAFASDGPSGGHSRSLELPLEYTLGLLVLLLIVSMVWLRDDVTGERTRSDQGRGSSE